MMAIIHEEPIRAPSKRPVGAWFIAILESFQGLLFLFLGALSLLAVTTFKSKSTAAINDSDVNSTAGLIVGGILAGSFLFLGLVLLLSARYLWKIKGWALWATVVLEVLLLLGSLWNIVTFVGGSPIPYMNWFPLVIALAGSVVAQPVVTTVGQFAVGMIIFPIVILLYILVDANMRAAYRR